MSSVLYVDYVNDVFPSSQYTDRKRGHVYQKVEKSSRSARLKERADILDQDRNHHAFRDRPARGGVVGLWCFPILVKGAVVVVMISWYA